MILHELTNFSSEVSELEREREKYNGGMGGQQNRRQTDKIVFFFDGIFI